MHPAVEVLLILQERDQRAAALQKELEGLPGLRERARAAADGAAKRLEEARQRLKSLELERKALEGEERAQRELIARYQRQQLETRKNEEYAALTHEIERATERVSGLEEKQLLLMEEADSLGPDIERLRGEAEQARQELEKRLATLQEREKQIVARLEEVRASRGEFAARVEPDLLREYERLFSGKQGAAVVPLRDGICGGCHMRVPTQAALDARADKLVRCPMCGRIVYDDSQG